MARRVHAEPRHAPRTGPVRIPASQRVDASVLMAAAVALVGTAALAACVVVLIVWAVLS